MDSRAASAWLAQLSDFPIAPYNAGCLLQVKRSALPEKGLVKLASRHSLPKTSKWFTNHDFT